MLGSRQYSLLKILMKKGSMTSTEFDSIETKAESLHKTLTTLEERGLVTSEFGTPERKRGGKAKRIFTVTDNGKREVGEYERSFA